MTVGGKEGGHTRQYLKSVFIRVESRLSVLFIENKMQAAPGTNGTLAMRLVTDEIGAEFLKLRWDQDSLILLSGEIYGVHPMQLGDDDD